MRLRLLYLLNVLFERVNVVLHCIEAPADVLVELVTAAREALYPQAFEGAPLRRRLLLGTFFVHAFRVVCVVVLLLLARLGGCPTSILLGRLASLCGGGGGGGVRGRCRSATIVRRVVVISLSCLLS